jgi:hypothetical protein
VFRIVAATFHPAFAKAFTVSLPIPLFDPVISTVFVAMISCSSTFVIRTKK